MIGQLPQLSLAVVGDPSVRSRPSRDTVGYHCKNVRELTPWIRFSRIDDDIAETGVGPGGMRADDANVTRQVDATLEDTQPCRLEPELKELPRVLDSASRSWNVPARDAMNELSARW
jgi:hypothetical protein